MTKPVFDPRFYRRHNSLHPFWRRGLAEAHYRLVGRRRGYQPSALFDPTWFARRVHDLGLGAIRPGAELDAYIEDRRLWKADPHPFAFLRFEPFASAGPDENPLQAAGRTLATEAPLGVGHPLIDLGQWAASGIDPSIDGRASAGAAMRSIAEHVTRALRVGHDIAAPGAPDVLFVNGEEHCPACTQYRIWAPARALESAGLRVGIVDARDLDRLEGVAPRVAIVVVFRARMTQTLRRFLTRARHLGARIGFDCDDLLFGKPLQVGLQVDSYGHRETLHSNAHAADMNQVVDASDFAIVPTETLGAVLEDMGVHHTAVNVCPSFLSPRQFACAASRNGPATTHSRKPNFSAASGTWTHHEDFGSAIHGISLALRERPAIGLTTIGAVKPTAFPELDQLPDQVQHDGRILTDWGSYVERYSRFTANLVPLDLDNGFCQAKSEVKYIEAALAGTPTVGSATEAYQRALAGGGGILVRSEDDWSSALIELCDNGSRAAEMGRTARADVETRYGPQGSYARQYVDTLLAEIEAGSHAEGGHLGQHQELKRRVSNLPSGATAGLYKDSRSRPLLFADGRETLELVPWQPRLSLDGPVPRDDRLQLIETPRQAEQWLAASDPGASVVVCGPELAAAVATRGVDVVTAAPWVDPIIFYPRIRDPRRGLCVVDAGRLGMEDAPVELNARLLSVVEPSLAADLDILVLTRVACALPIPDVLAWQWPGSPVELASLLRQATRGVRIDALWWDAATTALATVVGSVEVVSD